MKILHLTNDDIFFDNAYSQFEACYPNKNTVVVWSDRDVLEKITSTNKKVYLTSTINNLKNNLNPIEYDLIVFHSLSLKNAIFTNNIKFTSAQKLIWMVHGFEVYGLSKFNDKFVYSNKTKKRFGPKFSFANTIKNVARPLVEKIKLTDNKQILKAIRRMDYIGILYVEEYKLITQKLNLYAKWLPFTYYPLEKITEGTKLNLNSNNILVGNSATLANNHIDVLDTLKSIGLFNNQKIFCPLSYGDENYAQSIKSYGEQCFGNNFIALTDFMPLTEYNKILSSCAIAIMNNYRQQAVGTILSMVYFGTKIFLSNKNTLFHYLKRIGVHVYSIEDELKTKIDLVPLTDEIKEKNRELIKNEINSEYLAEQLKKNLNEL